MTDAYLLTLPKTIRDRLVHEKARVRTGKPLYWLRWYLDELDDFDLQREPPVTRLVARDLPLLIVRGNWYVPDDPRWIAGRLSLRTEDVKRAVHRLTGLDRIVRVHAQITPNGLLQPSLFSDAVVERPPEPLTSQLRPDPLADPQAVTNAFAQPSRVDELLASHERVSESPRQEQNREELPSNDNNGSGGDDAYVPMPVDTNPIVQRLAGLVCRGTPAQRARSAAVIRYEAEGLPDSLIARAVESYMTRRPRPGNPGGYVVETLRKIRAESGLPDQRARIDREPDL